MMRQLPPDRLETTFFPLEGGLDTITPQVTIRPGCTIDTENFEIPSEGGYRRIYGYERYDGQASPSQANLTLLFAATTFAVTSGNVGATVTGASSGTTATIAYIDPGMSALPNGLPGYQSASGNAYMAVTVQTGTFTAGENIKIGATVIGVYATSSTPTNWSGFNDNIVAESAANIYRALINPVPGSGAVLGVWVYNSNVYAFRNNSAGTHSIMYMASTSGWTAITLPITIPYTGGNAALGNLQATTEQGGTGTLTQGGVTATVKRITLASGSFVSGTAAGILVISGIAGGAFAAGAATATGGATLTLSGGSTQLALNPGGQYEFQNYAFSGSTNSFRMYGVDGANKAFEFDGTNYVPITTGMATDTPQFMRVHQHYLMLVFGASVQYSSVGNPFAWSVVLGAGEIDLGDDCTGLIRGLGNEVTGGLILFTKNITYALYGTSPLTWNLVPVAPESGGRAYSAQNLMSPVYLDKLGITMLTQTLAYGNYEQSIISERIKKFVKQRLDFVQCSTVVRNDNQYRLFFNDGTFVILTFRDRQVEGSMIGVAPNVFNCVCETTDFGGALFAGDQSTGYVYQLNVGRSFDGAQIPAYFRLAYNHCKSPLIEKHFRRATFDMYQLGPAYVAVGYNLSLNAGESDQSAVSTIGLANGGAASWDVSSWDTFYWDADSYSRITAGLDCDGTDISILISSVSDNQLPFTIQACLLEYSKRRQRRDHY